MAAPFRIHLWRQIESPRRRDGSAGPKRRGPASNGVTDDRQLAGLRHNWMAHDRRRHLDRWRAGFGGCRAHQIPVLCWAQSRCRLVALISTWRRLAVPSALLPSRRETDDNSRRSSHDTCGGPALQPQRPRGSGRLARPPKAGAEKWSDPESSTCPIPQFGRTTPPTTRRTRCHRRMHARAGSPESSRS